MQDVSVHDAKVSVEDVNVLLLKCQLAGQQHIQYGRLRSSCVSRLSKKGAYHTSKTSIVASEQSVR